MIIILESVSSKAEKSPCQKLVNKIHQKQKNSNPDNISKAGRATGAGVRLRHQNKENNNRHRQRLVQSMYVEKTVPGDLSNMFIVLILLLRQNKWFL